MIGVLAPRSRDMAAESSARRRPLESERWRGTRRQCSRRPLSRPIERVTFSNGIPRQAIFGWSRQEVMGKQLMAWCCRSAAGHRRKMRQELLRNRGRGECGGGETFEIRTPSGKGGEPVKIGSSMKALRRRSGAIVKALIRETDSQEKIARDEQLRRHRRSEAVAS